MKSTFKYERKTIELATILDALAHPARLQILLYLSGHKGCPAGNISDHLPISKSTVSKHMSKLKDVGLITCSPSGLCLNYQLNGKVLKLSGKYLSEFFKQIETCMIKQENSSLSTDIDSSQTGSCQKKISYKVKYGRVQTS